MKFEGFQELFRFEGFIIDTITCSEGFVQIALHRDRRRKLSCPHCGHRMAINKHVVREVYDLPMGTATCVKVAFETVQGKCSRCGHAKTFLSVEGRGARG